MHVIKVERVGDARYLFCECGRALALLRDGCYSDGQLSDVVLGHRQHALFEANVSEALRVGSTTQRHAPIDPMKHAALTTVPRSSE